MAWKVNKEKLYEVTIYEPETGEEAKVYLRKMDQGDLDDRLDQVMQMRVEQRRKGAAEQEAASIALGALVNFDRVTSIVKWDLPFPVTEQDINELDPEVIEPIDRKIAEINPRLNSFGGRNPAMKQAGEAGGNSHAVGSVAGMQVGLGDAGGEEDPN
jgi:hypothetical protein